MENGEINCTSIAGSSLEPRTYIHTYKFFRVRAPARSHFSSPTFDSSLLFLVDASDLYNHDSSVNLSLLSIDAPSHDISSNGAPFSFDNCRCLRAAASVLLLLVYKRTANDFENSFRTTTFELFLNVHRCQIALLRDE